ncbi:MAG: glycosyltransferase [Chitinophagales bacterium]
MKHKILHIHSNKVWRGAEQQIDYIINYPSSMFEHYLFCVQDGALHQKNKNKTVFGYKKHFGFDILAAWNLKKYCAEKKIDLLHLHDSHAINTYQIAHFFGLKIKAVIHRHVLFPIKHPKKYTKNIAKIICSSNAIKQTLETFIDADNLVVIHPSVDVQLFQKNKQKQNLIKTSLALENTAKLIGIVAALEEEKNVIEFIEIAQQCIKKKSNYHFIIIGTGSLYEKYKATYQNQQIHFLGFRNDIPVLLSELDIFLFTSKTEGFGQVIIEAMAANVCVISKNFPAVYDTIQHEKTGFIYTDKNEVCTLLETILQSSKIQAQITQQAAVLVQQFDVPLMMEKIEKCYLSVL